MQKGQVLQRLQGMRCGFLYAHLIQLTRNDPATGVWLPIFITNYL